MPRGPGVVSMALRILAGIGSGAGTVAVRDGMLFGRPLKTLDNGLVTVSVTPQIGGRVLDFSLKAGDRRMLRIARENTGRRPDEP